MNHPETKVSLQRHLGSGRAQQSNKVHHGVTATSAPCAVANNRVSGILIPPPQVLSSTF